MSIVKLTGESIEFPLPIFFHKIVYRLRAPVLSLKDTNASSRMMLYYDQQKFLLAEAELNGRRGFNGVQILWISILKELLKFGVPAQVISRLKDDFEAYYFFDYSTMKKYAQLEFIASLIIEYKSDIRLLVMPEGSYTFINHSIPSNLCKENYYSKNPHVSIPLFSKVQEVWEKVSQEKLAMRKAVFQDVRVNESAILEALRSIQGKADDVVITFRQQESPQSISINESIDLKRIESLCKFLRDCKNCKVEIAYGDTAGQPTLLRRKKTTKLPKSGNSKTHDMTEEHRSGVQVIKNVKR